MLQVPRPPNEPPTGAEHRGDRELVAVAIAIGGLLTAAWILFLVWFLFFYLL